MVPKRLLIGGYPFLLLLNCTRSDNAAEPGFLARPLKILSPREVKPRQALRRSTAENYANYQLIILSRGEKKEVTRVTADKDGNYQLALPPGDYILDAERRKAGHIHARAQ